MNCEYLEELYYYTYDEKSRYISELKAELKKDGYISDDKIVKTFALKEEFQNSYKTTKIWYNTQIDNPERKKKPLDDIIKNVSCTYIVKSLELREEEVELDQKQDTEKLTVPQQKQKTIPIQCSEIERHIFLKAVNIKQSYENSLYQFKQLRQELDIASIDELQTRILAEVSLTIRVESNISYEDIPNTDKLAAVIQMLDAFFTELKKYIIPKKGGEFKAGCFRQFFSTSKTKTIHESTDDSIANHDWYMLDSFAGTSEEKALIDCIQNSIGNLEEKYEKIALLKNEEIYKIYDFEQGRGFQPDFLLFLKDKDKQYLHYQIFIEPKGRHLLEHDEWKQTFLLQIAKKYGCKPILQAEHVQYKLIGLPFFNTENNKSFEDKYKELYH